MRNLRWLLIAVGALAIGSMAIALGPDVRRYMRIRSM